MIKIYDSLINKKKKLKKKNINIYLCGVTVYDKCHIGHARIFIFFDTIIRYLIYKKYKIKFIRNITDIDDKIIKKAKKNNKTIKFISEKYTNLMHEDFKKLNIIEPTFEPKATLFIKQVLKIIKKIKLKKFTYKDKNNNLYFDILKSNNYGKLSKKVIKDLEINKRIKSKKQKLDFVLWKNPSKYKNIYWKSDIGIGRPGWHTECLAMIKYYSKKKIDIHAGGKDLIFPHHENELTQHESIYKYELSNIWMHIGFVNINKEKMSKSKKNTISIKEILKKTKSEYLKFFFLSSKYRSDINFSQQNIEKSIKSLNKLYRSILNIKNYKNNYINRKLKTKFIKIMDDDLNTPKVISLLFYIAKKIKNSSGEKAIKLASSLINIGQTIGILTENPKVFLNINNKNIKNIKKINLLIKKREIARKSKNWILADNIRNKLKKMNIKLEDSKNKTIFINE